MNPTSPIDPRAKRWAAFTKYAAILVVGFFVAPFIWTAIGGLVGLVVAGALIGTTWMVLPAVGSFAGNMRLKLVKAEAARNPVETLTAEYQRQSEALDQRKTAIGRLNGQIASFADKLDAIGDKYGKADSNYVKLASQLKDLKRVSKNREDKWQAAYVQVKLFAQEIERAGMVWEAAQAAAAAQESSGLTEDDLMAKLKTDTSLDTIRDAFNTTLASLDTDLMQSDAQHMVDAPVQAALPAPDSARVLDVDSVITATPVKSRR